MFEQSKPTFVLVKLTPYHEVHIYTQGKLFGEDDISAYEYSKIRVRKCSALSQLCWSVNKDKLHQVPTLIFEVDEAGESDVVVQLDGEVDDAIQRWAKLLSKLTAMKR